MAHPTQALGTLSSAHEGERERSVIETGYRSPGERRLHIGSRRHRQALLRSSGFVAPLAALAGVEIADESRADGRMTAPRHKSEAPGCRPRIRVLVNPNSGEKAGIPTNTATEDEVRTAMEPHFPGLGGTSSSRSRRKRRSPPPAMRSPRATTSSLPPAETAPSAPSPASCLEKRPRSASCRSAA